MIILILSELVSKETEKEVKNLYLSLCELLSHFWKCFPPASQQMEQKVVKMHEALHRFHAAKLKPFEVRRSIEVSVVTEISSKICKKKRKRIYYFFVFHSNFNSNRKK